MKIERINPEKLAAPRGYAHAVAVPGNHRTIYIGGQNALDAKGNLVGGASLADQTRQRHIHGFVYTDQRQLVPLDRFDKIHHLKIITTAVTGLKNGRLVELQETEELLELAVREALEVAQAAGIRIETENPVEHTKKVARLTAANRSSMLQDVTNRRQTEIDVINGAIVNEGKKLGVPTPVNLALTNLVRVRQKTYDEFSV
mgnify:CR=1 FL=1